MTTSHSRPRIALVVRWPASVSAALAQQVQRRLIDGRVRATWSLERREQLPSLATAGPRLNLEVALLMGDGSAPMPAGASDQEAKGDVSQRLAMLSGGAIDVQTLHVSSHATCANRERWLRGLGIRAVVTDASGPAAVRPLPFGMWQLTPSATAPRTGGWMRWFAPNAAKTLLASDGGDVRVAVIDLGGSARGGAGASRKVDLFVANLAAAQRNGAADVITVGEAMDQLSESTAVRPQRSILRAAA